MSPPERTRTRSLSRRALRWSAAHPLIAGLLLISGVAAAAITISYTTTSSVTTGVTPAPIQFVAGDDTGGLTDYVTAFTISTNKTYLTSTVKGVPEASLVVGSYFKLQNVDDAPHTVTLSASNVTNSLVTAYTLGIYTDGDALVDTLDLRAASGTVTATATIPASTTYYTRLTLTLATGAGSDNVALSSPITLTFT